jgi:hypothetical protein
MHLRLPGHSSVFLSPRMRHCLKLLSVLRQCLICLTVSSVLRHWLNQWDIVSTNETVSQPMRQCLNLWDNVSINETLSQKWDTVSNVSLCTIATVESVSQEHMTFPGYIRTCSRQTQSDGYFSRTEYVNMYRITTQRPSWPWTTILVWCADNDSNNAWHFEKRKNNTVGVNCVQSNNQTVSVSQKMNQDTERCEFCVFFGWLLSEITAILGQKQANKR